MIYLIFGSIFANYQSTDSSSKLLIKIDQNFFIIKKQLNSYQIQLSLSLNPITKATLRQIKYSQFLSTQRTCSDILICVVGKKETVKIMTSQVYKQMNQNIEFDLKIKQAGSDEVNRGDYIFKNGSIWSCASKGANLFINIETKQHQQINEDKFMKLSKLQLIPLKWEMDGAKIYLQGRELGLGPEHRVAISWLKSFPELDLVAQHKQKGKDLRHKAILVETTAEKTYLIVGVQLL